MNYVKYAQRAERNHGGGKVKEIRRMTYEQIEDRNKEIEIIKRNQVEILKLKGKIVKMKNSLEQFKRRQKQAHERIKKLEGRATEIAWYEKQKEKRMKRNEWT